MEQWMKICMVLCTCGFLKDIRPSEPFVTEFLTGEWRNITREQVSGNLDCIFEQIIELNFFFISIDRSTEKYFQYIHMLIYHNW
jgi:hypothetical protein